MESLLSSILFRPPKSSYSSGTLSNLRRLGTVPCLHIKRARPRGVIMYLHGNAMDLGKVGRLAYTMSDHACCDLVAVEYPGYGVCPGTATVSAAVEAVHRALVWIEANYTTVPIYVVGRSIGTGIGMEVVAKYNHTKVQRVFLISPFESISQLAYDVMGPVIWAICPDVLRTIDNIGKGPCRVHLIHGRRDQLIPAQHSMNMHARHGTKVSMHMIDGGHNDLDFQVIGQIIANSIK